MVLSKNHQHATSNYEKHSFLGLCDLTLFKKTKTSKLAQLAVCHQDLFLPKTWQAGRVNITMDNNSVESLGTEKS